MFTLEQTDCKLITAPLSLSLFLASQVSSFSQLRFPHGPISTRKTNILDHPLRSTVHLSSPTRFTHTPLKLTYTPLRLKVSASAHNSTPVTDRLLSAAIYTIPLLDSLGYGAHRVPPYLYPGIYHLYNSTPFTRYAALVIIHMFVLKNPKFRNYVRLNALQAILLSFVLQVPSFALKVVFPVWPVGILVGYDFMFLLVVFGFSYIMGNTILGNTPQIPFFTHAAGIQL